MTIDIGYAAMLEDARLVLRRARIMARWHAGNVEKRQAAFGALTGATDDERLQAHGRLVEALIKLMGALSESERLEAQVDVLEGHLDGRCTAWLPRLSLVAQKQGQA